MTALISRNSSKIIGLVIAFCLLVVFFMSSIAFGQTPMTLGTVLDAFIHFDPASSDHIIIRTTRVDRAVIATVIGASLAISGTLMQALTRNPLASPSIFGINAGAVFFIVMAATFFSASSLLQYMWLAFLGAAVAAALVYFLGSLGGEGLSTLRIVLAGAAVSALFTSFTSGMLVISENSLQGVLFWLAGSVSGRTLDMLVPLLPFISGAGLLAFGLGNTINILTSGEEVAKGLGQRTTLVKLLMAAAIVVLAGGSVAIGGSIGFIGLIVPHIVRGLIGMDHRWVIPYSAVLGAGTLLLADIGSRFIIMPQEMPIGVMTAFLGAPFFIYLARRGFRER
ncbi:FecCD family ABC transporter permease [Paenibacillus fonticola]|uniref:FecCD family ABC transporter permease n=1 Tax=Paenibacillus fonticola TaxID=379896 RepID=UPI00039E491E|nr:iron ABC transporter permease [Paenibacillus fonticola]